MSKPFPSKIFCMPTLTLTSLALLSLVVLSWGHSMERETELQKIFQLRNEDEWKTAWHSEKHSRCRDQLLIHMDWACQKDIYRLDKKFEAPEGIFIGKPVANTVIKAWSGYIVRRKRENKSITDECCNTSGCTWEEYAEYCPAHRRVRISRSRTK
ncbi:probable insulin-like peptide 7 [Folsomia candida]|uniref:probable insulin-like peptide 7 n=1 Tax=Folsomia candida TaxID=158441 RepID=UPI000B901DA9|nr:probable insulin-like peptide 7 [Folsomia candida]